jgi:hypothetical protein
MAPDRADELRRQPRQQPAAQQPDTADAAQRKQGGLDIHEAGGQIEEEVVRTNQGASYVQQEQATRRIPSSAERRHARARNARRVIYFFTHSIVIFTVIRLVLQALGAEPGNAFFTFLRVVTGPFVSPFGGLFNEPLRPGYEVSELSMAIAIAVFYLMAWIASGIATFLITRPYEDDNE